MAEVDYSTGKKPRVDDVDDVKANPRSSISNVTTDQILSNCGKFTARQVDN
jgi:hypothetical protein